jgi:thiamine biosynthesis lipoprotein
LRVEHIMGMPIEIDLRDEHLDPIALDDAFAWLRLVDETFSTYKPASEISRLARGELTISQCRPEVDEVLARCAELSDTTGGFFSVRAAGQLDPSGFVKGWAVGKAADILGAAGARAFSINAGGDIVLRGRPGPGEPRGASASGTPSSWTSWPRCWPARTSRSRPRASMNAARTSSTRTRAARRPDCSPRPSWGLTSRPQTRMQPRPLRWVTEVPTGPQP